MGWVYGPCVWDRCSGWVYGISVGISVWAGCRDQCMGLVYGLGVGMGVWDGCRDQCRDWCMGWV